MKNQYRGFELRRGVEVLAHKVCQHIGLAPVVIEWSTHVTTAGISSNGTMYLSDILDEATVPASLFKRYCGFVIHELCHRKWTDFCVRTDDRYLDQLHNAVEDAWIEHNAIDGKLTGNVGELLTDLVDQMVAEAMVNVSDWADPAQYPFVLAIYLRRHAQNKIPLASGLEPIFAQAAHELTSARSSTDTLVIAQRVLNELKNLQQPQPQQPESGKGDAKADQNTPQDTSDGPQKADQGQDKGEGATDQKNGSDAGQARAPASDCEPMEVEPQIKVAREIRGAGSYNKAAKMVDSAHHLDSSPNPMFNLPTPVSARLQHEVRKLFENTDVCEWNRNHKVGAINSSALPFVGTTDRVFKRRFEQDGVDSAVVILVDVSSSMFNDHDNQDGARAKNAVATCQSLLDTLGRAGVATCVLAFDTYTSIIKPWSMSVAQAKHKVSCLSECGSTNDYFAVRVAHEMLYARPEARKVLFVLTDGEGKTHQTRQQVESGEKLGITTIGIGIQLNVAKVYPNNVFVKE